MQQSRFLFVDFDGLSASVHDHLRRQPAVFRTDFSVDTFPLDAHNLLKLLSGQDAVVACRRGVYYGRSAVDKRKFTAAGWEMRNKSALEHRLLESLLKRNLNDAGRCEGKQTKTLVLATGNTKDAVLLKCLDAYFAANWRVQLFCLRRHGMDVADMLRAAHPNSFQCVYLDRLMKKLLRTNIQDVLQAEPSNQENDVETSISASADRFVLMDLDSIVDTVFRSTSIVQNVPRASSARELRMDFRRLTERTCGAYPAKVQRQVATYYNAHPLLVQGIMSLRWITKKQPATKAHLKFLAELISTDLTDSQKVLVLVMGDGALDTIGKTSLKCILEVLVAQQWHIEVHAWIESLGDVFSVLQREYPTHVTVKLLDDDLHELLFVKQLTSGSRDSNNQTLRIESERSESVGSVVDAGSDATSNVLCLQQLVLDLSQRLAEVQAVDMNQVVDELEQRLQVQRQDFTRQLTEQQEAYSHEIQQFVQHASETELDRRHALQEREEMLTCPITQCLYETPVIAACCGKTFSKGAVEMVQSRNQSCPWCRQQRGFTTHPNLEVANLVEHYKAERDALDALL